MAIMIIFIKNTVCQRSTYHRHPVFPMSFRIIAEAVQFLL